MMRYHIPILVFMLVAAFLWPSAAAAQNYSVAWVDISAGGTVGSSASYIASPSMGDVVVGTGSSANFQAEYSLEATIEELLPTAVDPETPLPIVTSLHQNHPNPFNPNTSIHFSLAEKQMVELRVYNIMGRLVRTLLHEVRGAGANQVAVWNGRDDGNVTVASGVYFYRLTTQNYVETRKMVLVK